MEKHSTTFTMKVGFFLPTYNNLEELKLAINSINPFEVPIVVGIDGSTDGTKEWLKSNQIQFFEHPGGGNRGRAATRNLALQLDWDWVVFMDSDMEFTGTIDPLIQNPSNVEVYVGRIRYSRKNNPWINYCSKRGVHKYTNGPVPYRAFSTGICAVPMALFKHLNGFDEQFITYGGEDLEFAIRIKNNHSPFFKASFLKTTSKDNKSLDEALIELKKFGETGLKIIQKKHTNYDPYQINSRIPIAFEGIARKFLSLMPKKFHSKIIHYLVYCAVKKGFYSKST